MRRVLLVFAGIVGLYLIGRAVAEPFVVDMADPATYERDWGGPTLAVHMGPGLLAAVLMVGYVLRRRRAVRPPSPGPS